MERQYRPRRRQEQESPGTAWQMVRLVVCLIILGGVLLARSVYPEDTKAFLSAHIAEGMDYAEVLAEAGDGLRAFFSGAPRPEDLPSDASPSVSPEPSSSPPEPSPSSPSSLSPSPEETE